MTAAANVKSIHDIRGWFNWIDQMAFEHFLSPGAVVPVGDLVELGAYLGKSAALIGRFKGPNETFTVCDLFGMPAEEISNQRENARSYSTLDRQAFERNYLALFDELPLIIQDFSSTIVDHVDAGQVRFMHVDASHMYEHVVADVASAQRLLKPNAVVVFDDYRSDHTPGVSAAVWEAVFNKNLQPICLTQQKFYGTFGDRSPHQERLLRWVTGSDEYAWEIQTIAGAPVIRIAPKATPIAAPKADTRAKASAETDVNRVAPREDRAQPLATIRASTGADMFRRVRRKVKTMSGRLP